MDSAIPGFSGVCAGSQVPPARGPGNSCSAAPSEHRFTPLCGNKETAVGAISQLCVLYAARIFISEPTLANHLSDTSLLPGGLIAGSCCAEGRAPSSWDGEVGALG